VARSYKLRSLPAYGGHVHIFCKTGLSLTRMISARHPVEAVTSLDRAFTAVCVSRPSTIEACEHKCWAGAERTRRASPKWRGIPRPSSRCPPGLAIWSAAASDTSVSSGPVTLHLPEHAPAVNNGEASVSMAWSRLTRGFAVGATRAIRTENTWALQ
jgi:hypothetical protein